MAGAAAATEALSKRLKDAFETMTAQKERDKIAGISSGEQTVIKSEWPGAGINSVMGPQCEQTAGTPFTFYQRVANADLKPTGLRLSACLAAMDNCRTDLFTTCDMSVESFRNVNDPFVEVAIELCPAVKKLSRESSRSGLLHKTNRGALLSWLRLEAVFGWPAFPMRSEETTIYLVGKDKQSSQREPLCTARFNEAFTDKDEERALQGDTWVEASLKFWASVAENHTVSRLSERRLEGYYGASDEPFMPTKFAKVSWLMSHSFGDLWEILYHGKTPELLWDVNKLAGGEFADLVVEDSDPQALAINLPKMMEVGSTYEVFCYLETLSRRAVYVLVPQGKSTNGDVVLAVCARYNWKNLPQDGKTLCREDLQVLSGPSRAALVNFGTGQDFKGTKVLDFSKLHQS